jgi:hypothetical protein
VGVGIEFKEFDPLLAPVPFVMPIGEFPCWFDGRIGSLFGGTSPPPANAIWFMLRKHIELTIAIFQFFFMIFHHKMKDFFDKVSPFFAYVKAFIAPQTPKLDRERENYDIVSTLCVQFSTSHTS